MRNSTNFFSRFINFAFSGQINSSRPIINIDEANIEHQTQTIDIHEVNLSPEQVRIKLVVRINWLLMGICIISFIFIIIYPLIYPDKAVPDIIQNAFFTTLGWFGGVLGAFFQVDQNRQ